MPRASVIIKTVLQCLLELILLVGIPYALLSIPQTSALFTQAGIADSGFLSDLAIFALVSVILIVVKNFSRPGSLINLVSGLALVSSGIIFFLLLGSVNTNEPRFGLLTFFLNIQGSKIAVTVEFISLALLWIAVAGLKTVNLVLGFIEARHSRETLKLPLPPQAILVPAQSQP